MIDEIRKIKPLIHCITNPISINQCANAILALGARPIMAEHPEEVSEITKESNALLLNLGNITDARMKSIKISADIAVKNNIPFILDAVGVACSEFRRRYVVKLLKKYRPTVIKGNYSEIKALFDFSYKSKGVDSEIIEEEAIRKIAVKLSKRYGTIVVASGKTDVVTDGRKFIYIKNGFPQLTQVTGTGCMLGALCACFISESPDITGLVNACITLGVCGELSQTENGTGSYMVNLIDNLCLITDEKIKMYKRTEEFEIETV